MMAYYRLCVRFRSLTLRYGPNKMFDKLLGKIRNSFTMVGSMADHAAIGCIAQNCPSKYSK